LKKPKGVIFEEYEVRELEKWEAESLHRVCQCRRMSKVIHILNNTANNGWKLLKGGEKVRPYLEVKVVKVKKPQPQGNWVNGENLDAIKFPCFCKYWEFGETHYGLLTRFGDGTIVLHNISNKPVSYYTPVATTKKFDYKANYTPFGNMMMSYNYLRRKNHGRTTNL